MRPVTVLLAIACLSTVAVAAEDTEPKATADYALPPFKAEHPGDTALSQDANGKWRFRSFPGLATLYIHDKDTPGKSNCGAPCTSAWAPLLASSTENKTVGDWTLIPRPDGRHQWAYKGHPVYLRYHDLPADEGNIQRQGFRPLEP